jgi:hypothetical protein
MTGTVQIVSIMHNDVKYPCPQCCPHCIKIFRHKNLKLKMDFNILFSYIIF